MSSLFITGATGFIGRSLVSKLDLDLYRSIYCLSRSGLVESIPPGSHIQVIKGDLRHPESYAAALASCRTVIHLAAVTGMAARDQYIEVNARGAEELIKQCEKRNVENFLYVSTIAVKYQDKSRYYYAQSKEQGEDAVRRSSLRYLIVRPTIVIGPGGGPWRALSKLARGPFVALPGDGKALMQPIALEDVVACLRMILKENLFTNQVIELGGPEEITCEQFLKKIHMRLRGKEPAIFHLPLKPLIAILSALEKILSNAAPLNAGQLSAFWQNSTAEPIAPRCAPALAGLRITSVDQLIERMVSYE